MKTDLRTRYTRQVIRAAFFTLLQKQPVERITVREVCDLAQINRGTFYKHYRDCFDLAEKLEEELVQRFAEGLNFQGREDGTAAIVSILRQLRDDPEMTTLLRWEGRRGNLARALMSACFHCMKTHITGFPAEEPALDSRYVFLVGGSTGLVEYWMHSGMQEPPEELGLKITEYCGAFLSGLKNKSPEQENGSKF